MLRKLWISTLAALVLLISAGCAMQNPQDAALQQNVTEALGEFSPGVYATVAGDRVYLNGDLRNFNDLQTVVRRVQGVRGVHTVMYDDIVLTEPGSPHDSDSRM